MLKMDEPYVYQGISYRTSEHFYQAMKMPKDRLDLRAELAAMGQYETKKAVRDKMKFKWRDDWSEEESLKVMEHILRFKFKAGTSWAAKLVETEGEIVENNNWGDVFWGFDVNQGRGENHLGKILMKLRSELCNVPN